MRGLFFIVKIVFCSHKDDYYEHFPSESLIWSEAVTFCEEKGGALATFKDQKMLDQVCKLFRCYFSISSSSLFILSIPGLEQQMVRRKENGSLKDLLKTRKKTT